MRPEEKPAVRAMFRRSFPFLLRLFFSWTPHTLVAVRAGAPVAAIVLKTYPLPRAGTGGLVAWIFTAPGARGTGAGQLLTDAGLKLLADLGCDEVTACVAGYNPSSSKLFATRGFAVLPPGEQLRRYGRRLLPTWWHLVHMADVGQFLWARPGPVRPDRPGLQWWGTWVATSLIALLAGWRAVGFGAVEALAFVAVPSILLIFFGARWLAMSQVAASHGLELRYRAWESGFSVSVVVALVFGGLFPCPGSLYPASDRWSYRALLPRLGPVALAGVLPTLVLTAAAWSLPRFADLSPTAGAWLGHALGVGTALIVFDIVLIFWPFVSFNGRRIWDWNRTAWVTLVLPALVVIFL